MSESHIIKGIKQRAVGVADAADFNGTHRIINITVFRHSRQHKAVSHEHIENGRVHLRCDVLNDEAVHLVVIRCLIHFRQGSIFIGFNKGDKPKSGFGISFSQNNWFTIIGMKSAGDV